MRIVQTAIVIIAAACLLVDTVMGAGCPMYKQCDSRWGSQQLGTSSNTICKAGCAMSSVAMALACRGVSTDPSHFNTWLRNNGGYVQQDLIVWSKADAFGKMKFEARGTYSCSYLQQRVRGGSMLILNVRHGGHWVLATGVVDGGLAVNDPGYSVGSYSCADIGTVVIYA